MSKLDELIKEYCPDGVEYKTLKEISTDIFRGSGIKRDEVTSEGIPCVRYGEIYTTYGIWFDECVSHTVIECVPSPKYFEYGDILFVITGESVEDIAKTTAYVGHEKCLAGGDIVVLKHNQNPKYLSYALATTDARKQKSAGKVKSKVVHASVPAIEKITIPVPPLPVQEEIVRILDSFTELTAELQAELQARKKQYENYRDDILKVEVKNNGTKLDELIKEYYPDGVEYKTIGEICVVSAGGDVPKDAMAKERTEEFCIPIISNGIAGNALYGYTNLAKITEPAVTVAARGTIGYAEYRDYPYYPVIRLLTVIPKDGKQLCTKYLYYWLVGKTYSVPTGGIPQLTAPELKKIVIPVPPLPVQEEIVRILDQMNTLCTSLSSGLPAEIEARQKQYEHYRDKLLTFKPLEV